METNKPLGLIPTRDSAEVTKWLLGHPEICLITRDGSRGYAKAVHDASPTIQQVADRWHVLHQLFEASKKAVYSCIPRKWNASSITEDKKVETTLAQESDSVPWNRSEERWQRIQQSQQLFSEGYRVATIARKLGVVRNTVYSDLNQTVPPYEERASPDTAYYPLVSSLVKDKMSSDQIEETCRSQGYTGSLDTLTGMITSARNRSAKLETPGLSFRQKTLRLLWNPDNEDVLEELQSFHPDFLSTFPQIKELSKLIHSFRSLIKEKAADQLPQWIENHKGFENKSIQSFFQGVKNDLDAILLGIRLHWSNGPTEGNVNRLKTLKRLMYGRAGFRVLEKRVLYHL